MVKHIKILSLFVWLSWTFLQHGTVNSQALPAAAQLRIDSLVESFRQVRQVPGISVSIAWRGKLVFSKGYGMADVEQQVPVVPDHTRFRIASISKTLTADALMHLVEAGQLDLDAPVQQYVPSFPAKRWPVTVRQVAGHLGGIRHYRNQEFLLNKHYNSVNESLDIFKDDSLLFEPGSRYSYSSYGYNLLSAVIEGASGMSYLDYMQQKVLVPLGMRQTVADKLLPIIPGRGRYYMVQDSLLLNAPNVDNSYKWAGGGYLSTSEDLIRFALGHLRPGYLSAASWHTLTTSQHTTDGQPTGYGIGWFTQTDSRGRHWVGHSGGAIGGTGKLVVYPDEEIVIVILTNLTSARLGDLPHQLAWIVMEQADH